MSPPTAEQSAHLNTLEDMASMLQKAQVNMKKCPKARLTEGYVKVRCKSIDSYWDTFKQAHNALNKCTPREQKGILPYFLNEDYFKIEDLYLCLQGDLTDLLSRLESKNNSDVNMSSASNNSQTPFAQLPRIQLPAFNGKYEDWPTYQDLFTSLVHNTSLSNVQKLHYLKTSISGEAESLLRHIHITETNYEQAWELLKKRYGNKKMIVTSLLKRLFGQRKISNQSATQIKSVLDTTTECLNTLNNLNINTDSWDPIIIFLVSQKLDTESLKDWEEHAHKERSDEISTWEEMKNFLESKFRTLELVAPLATSSREKTNVQKSFYTSTTENDNTISKSAQASLNSHPLCSYCQGSHYIFHCKEYGQLSVEERRHFARTNRLCYNCLNYNHNVFTCKQRTCCRVCKGRHHSLLHEVRDSNKEKVAPPPEQIITTAHFSEERTNHKVLLATSQIQVKASNGDVHILRALIDQGSEASFVSARAVELLGLRRVCINGKVTGIGEGAQLPVKHLVDLIVTSRFNKRESIQVRAYVLRKISTRLPSHYIKLDWPQINALELADPNFNKPSGIDLLLGADVFCKIIEDGLVRMPDGIVAQKTTFGWILSGQTECETITNQHNIITLHITRKVTEDNEMLRKFWEIETDLYTRRKMFTEEEIKCEEIYKNTTKRHESGRYIVHLPLIKSIKETVEMCGETKQQAEIRFKHLERKFERDPKLKIEYSKVIKEYEEMGHMRKTNIDDMDKDAIYLPHHAVIREDKDTSRVRVVYDASAKGSNGYSLNDTMLVGPVLQPDLRNLILNWRKHKICVTGDIVKMYRMIMMTEDHTNLQRIVWRDTPDQKLESYNLQTVTFGTAAAPYLAVRTLSQLAEDEAHECPDIAAAIKGCFYMDDLMMGNESVEKTKVMCGQVRKVLKRGGFKMQKWSSNSEEVLNYLQENNCNFDETKEFKLDKVIRILGLTWDRKQDTFNITVNLPEITRPITKRSVLSDIARLFDPFGWLSPVIITAKVFIQRLWICNSEWDDELTLDLSKEWILYREELTELKNIKIPRWLKITPSNCNNIQIHGFADASTKGYAAVVYLRLVEHKTVNVALIASRTKVAPLKQLSVPKLELSAAALLAELINDLIEILDIPRTNIFAWTDSMVVLSWLQSHPSRWRTFVANRVADITRVLSNDRWRHVQSVENPADIATRGITASELVSHDTWWTGPCWLKKNDIEFHKPNIPNTDLEVKGSFHTIVEEKPIWERFSNLTRMKRVLAYCRRFLNKRGSLKFENFLTSSEMERILEDCIRYYQNLVYEDEIKDLKQHGTVKRGSSLITLSPHLDEKGLIRVGGRLQNASIPETTKHPIIIPGDLHITNLIVNDAHHKTLHGGIQIMISYIRTRYWVIGLKSAVKKCIHQCKICVVDKARVKYQLMGQLPAVRVNQYRAFTNSGVDYAGPVFIRTSKGRGHHATKGYICLFICMATHAIHLEAVSDLTSQAFIAAFRRFVARRGPCLNLYSDNATNFVGAAKELRDRFQGSSNEVRTEIAEILANDGTTWHFIPPRMPSYGGLWEAGIRSVKRHLFRISKDSRLTFEEMATLLAQIEACLNSRPLCKIDDSSDTPLTPGHFLVGEALISIPDSRHETKNISMLTRWQYIQRMTQDFWHRWRTEYLNTLQQRFKWQVPVPSPAIGDLVIVKDEDVPPTKWLLGRIKHLHPGSDNLVRVVTVQCKGNQELKRPLSKLILLP